MDFIFNQMNQLHHIGVTHSYWLVKCFAGPPVMENYLAENGQGEVFIRPNFFRSPLYFFTTEVSAGYTHLFKPYAQAHLSRFSRIVITEHLISIVAMAFKPCLS